jgi:negative regulator of sigma E activity
MDTISKLQQLDHFTREQIVRDSEFASIFPRSKQIISNKGEIDSLFPTITANDVYGYCLLVVAILAGINQVLSWM